MAKLVCEVTVRGQDVPSVITTAASIDPGSFLKLRPGVGKPFWWWATLRGGTLASVDFDGAPIVSDSVAENNAAVADMLANPPDANALLTWA